MIESNNMFRAQRHIITSFIVLLVLVLGVDIEFATAQGFSAIKGKVTTTKDTPLHLAHVMVKGSTMGAATDQQGRFQFRADTTGAVVITASMVGYQTVEKEVTFQKGKTVELNFDLPIEKVSIGEATVTASAFTTGEVEGVTLSPTEVVTTPGAAADIFRALKTFPGVSNIDNGSGLFVRGGDVSEVSFILDQASVVHPYKYESPTGGVFGTIPPFLVSGTYFSTGGFSAKYGNALSAVLAMESKGMPETIQLDANVGLAALSAGGSVPVIPGKLGVRFSGNRSLTHFMFEVNGKAEVFQQAPMGRDGNLSLIAKPYKGTTIKLFNYVNTSRVGVRVPRPSFEGTFHSEEQNRLHNLQWKQLWGNWLLKTSLSVNRYQKSQQFGGLDMDEEDRTYKVRSDLEFSGMNGVTWYAGMEWMRYGNRFTGLVPTNDEILDPSADLQPLDENFTTQRLGGYVEAEYQLLPGLKLQTGLRTDYENNSEDWTLDPRMSLRYQVDSYHRIRLAVGRYHQYAEPFQYNNSTGNSGLDVQQAWHYIAGYELKKELYHLRVEGYYKSYDDLIIKSEQQNLSNKGYGEAYGADFFFKYSDFLKTPFNGWISYSFLRSKRLHPRQLAHGYQYEYASSAFDITHNLNVVAKARIIGMLSGGATYRFSTGQPFTPVVNSEPTSRGYHLPIEGHVHSQRLPNFHRLDLNLSYYWIPREDWSVTFYASVSNVLNRKNVMDYTYNNDYSQRKPVYSDYSRFVYAGVTINVKL